MSLYISHVGQFGNVYGSLGHDHGGDAWFFLTAFMFLLRAEFNIEMERQTNARIRD